ncbi:hypothetical protein C8J57DRAFT_1254730 [Mycena rebaudengoi]|nr:hypothetical protein C8J57DRAFT_1254730 [Mycena rebaudengoi]
MEDVEMDDILLLCLHATPAVYPQAIMDLRQTSSLRRFGSQPGGHKLILKHRNGRIFAVRVPGRHLVAYIADSETSPIKYRKHDESSATVLNHADSTITYILPPIQTLLQRYSVIYRILHNLLTSSLNLEAIDLVFL